MFLLNLNAIQNNMQISGKIKIMDKNKIHSKKIIKAGTPLKEAKKALIMIHGRGGSAEDILSLESLFECKRLCFAGTAGKR